MGHYKSNLRDIEFNLFEVFGRQQVLGSGPYAEVDEETARSILEEVERLATHELAESLLDSDRNPPVYDPADQDGHDARGLREVLPGLHGRRVVAAGPARGAGRHRRPAEPALGGRRAGPGLQPRRAHVRLGHGLRPRDLPAGHRGAAQGRPADGRRQVGRDDGPHRARRRLRRRRRPHPGRAAGRRHLAHRGREALHHLGRARHDRQHRPPGPRPSRGRRPGHQGAVPLHRPEVPLRLGLRRARRAQRRLRHQRRAQDGPQGVDDLRAHLRRERAGDRLAGRRRPRRHRADVQGHRVRPDDGRHQGDRHPVDRLPQRARLRQDAGAGAGPHPDDRQVGAAGRRSPTIRTYAAR